MGKHLSQAEKDEIVGLHLVEGRPTRGLASELGISRSSILNWVRADRKNSAQVKFVGRRTNGTKEETGKLVQELALALGLPTSTCSHCGSFVGFDLGALNLAS